MSGFKLEYTDTAKNAAKHLPPSVKPPVKAAIEAITEKPFIGKPLRDELEGLRSYRVQRFRVIYRILEKTKRIQIIHLGHRKNIYTLVQELAKKASA